MSDDAIAPQTSDVPVLDVQSSDVRLSDLPEQVRRRVIALAAEAIGSLEESHVPAALRSVRKFTPPKRARLGAAAISASLDTDAAFRVSVASTVAADSPPAVTESPAAAAAMAYLTRPKGWQEAIAAAGAESPSEDVERLELVVSRLTEQLSALRGQGRADLDRMRRERDALTAEVKTLRTDLREAQRIARRAEERASAAEQELREQRIKARESVAAVEAQLRQVTRALTAAEAAAETARRADREGRALADIRIRLLLDVLAESAQGLMRELALPASELRPADLVEAVLPGAGADPARGLDGDDPGRLDALLRLPRAHLVVDGYNVTKSGYGQLPLEDQRARLLTGLSALSVQTGAEVTCCFDGAASSATLGAGGVRVLFTHAGEIADDLIRRLVSAEPPGRPVVVVSSDREVADGVRASGAQVAGAWALLRRLDKG